jgi:hypothetical protein
VKIRNTYHPFRVRVPVRGVVKLVRCDDDSAVHAHDLEDDDDDVCQMGRHHSLSLH